MPEKNEEKKKIESLVIAAARKAGAPLPLGEIPGEEPDFRIETEAGTLGIEVTELLRPASSNSGIVPVEEEHFHREVVQMAQEQHCASPDAVPAHVIVYFENARGKKQNKREMARTLVDFVKASLPRATPTIALSGTEVPEGLGSMSITSESGEWWSGECGGITAPEIHEQLASRIGAKNKLLPTYRANLPKGAQVWLLLYSRFEVSRGVPIPHGIDEWEFPFDFEKVFWWSCLEQEVVEIRKANSAGRL